MCTVPTLPPAHALSRQDLQPIAPPNSLCVAEVSLSGVSLSSFQLKTLRVPTTNHGWHLPGAASLVGGRGGARGTHRKGRGRQDGAAQRPGQVRGQSPGHTARPRRGVAGEARPRPAGRRQHASRSETQTQAEGNTGQVRGFILGTNQPLGHAASRELAGPVLICQICELRLSEELLLSFQKTHSCTPQSARSWTCGPFSAKETSPQVLTSGERVGVQLVRQNLLTEYSRRKTEALRLL